MYYKHNLDYKYPDRSDEHMITVKKVRTTVFDEKYPYYKKGFWYGVARVFLWIFLNIIAFPLLRITHGLKIYGKKNLKKYKKELKDGAITICNHVFMWDTLCVLKAIRPHLIRFPAWKTNLDGPNGPLIRWAGGIPVPTGNMRAMVKFKYALEEAFENKRWVHFFPEGSMWFFYPDIRPLKKAVFKYAVKYDKPIIPMAISFRPRKGIAKLWGKTPRADLHIGEVMFVDKTLSPKEAEEQLHKKAYHVMQEMVGITPDHPAYRTDQNIENYKKTM